MIVHLLWFIFAEIFYHKVKKSDFTVDMTLGGNQHFRLNEPLTFMLQFYCFMIDSVHLKRISPVFLYTSEVFWCCLCTEQFDSAVWCTLWTYFTVGWDAHCGPTSLWDAHCGPTPLWDAHALWADSAVGCTLWTYSALGCTLWTYSVVGCTLWTYSAVGCTLWSVDLLRCGMHTRAGHATILSRQCDHV